jgi:probable HAF family extracellular repeat protein
VYSDTFEQTYATPYDINDFGHVVGTWSWYNEMGSSVAFLYKNGYLRDLGSFPFGYPWGYSSASDINNSDQVIGSDGGQAFLYDASTNGTKYLGTLPGHNTSSASDINDSGQVVGTSATLGNDGYSYQNQHAFLYDSANEMKDLGTLPGYTDSRATAMNNSGQVVGYSYTPNEQNYHAFLYEDGEMKDLGTLGGNRSYAYDINNSGQVVGYSYTASGQSHAFLYEDGEMKDLGTLGGGSSSWANDINDTGQVVGEAAYGSSGRSHAFLYQNEEMTDLGNQWFPDGDCIGWNLNSGTYKINNEGQILVEAWRQDGYIYKYGALILTPTSDSPPDCQAPPAPTITSPENDTYESDGSFSVSGSAEAANTVELFEGTTSAGKTKADSSTGAWSIDLTDVSNGSHTYSAKATDAAGNNSSVSNTVTVMVGLDTTKPSTSATPSVQPTAAGWHNRDVTVNLKATDNQGGWGVKKITYSASGDQTIAQTDASADSVDVALDKEGTTTLTYYATDKAGNVEDKKTLTVSIDKTPASVDVQSISPEHTATGVSPSATIKVTYLESGSGINPSTLTQGFRLLRETRMAGGGLNYEPVSGKVSYAADSKTATFTPRTKLSKGKYLAITSEMVKDNAGNASDYKEWSFSVG